MTFSSIHFEKKGEIHASVVGNAILTATVAPAVSMHLPPADHYLTHLPKHPGCTACMDCKEQRKDCRDRNAGRQRKLVDVVKTDKVDSQHEITDAPKAFGDLVTSDFIFAIKRSSTPPARFNDTTSLVVRGKATGWVAAYPSKRESDEHIMEAVNNYKGSDLVKRWYSDGAPELHAVCRTLGIRHDTSDPHRSETNGLIERTNRTVIEGALCMLFQSGMPCKYWTTAITCFADN